MSESGWVSEASEQMQMKLEGIPPHFSILCFTLLVTLPSTPRILYRGSESKGGSDGRREREREWESGRVSE